MGTSSITYKEYLMPSIAGHLPDWNMLSILYIQEHNIRMIDLFNILEKRTMDYSNPAYLLQEFWGLHNHWRRGLHKYLFMYPRGRKMTVH